MKSVLGEKKADFFFDKVSYNRNGRRRPADSLVPGILVYRGGRKAVCFVRLQLDSASCKTSNLAELILGRLQALRRRYETPRNQGERVQAS